jgi:peroxiredoxin
MALIVFCSVLPWLLVAFGGWLGFQFLRQSGRQLLRLEAIEERLSQLSLAPAAAKTPARPEPKELLLGSPAPTFELPNLSGGRTSLASFRGRKLLVLFFNPRCGFCIRMAGDLARLPIDDPKQPLPVVISTGDAEENRKLVAEHGIASPVLLQEPMEADGPLPVGARYHAHGTPMGYLVDEKGRIASPLAIGAEALLALAGSAVVPSASEPPSEQKGNRDLADSKIRRDGLPTGTLAPDFTLPGLHGEELPLSQYRGREVVLVFSDPKCGPCNQIAPELEQFHRRTGAAQVVMVSRGEVEANRLKAEEHGLTFPIGLQKQWEVSRDYAMFATPIAYRVSAAGAIAEAVAVGVEAIRRLLARIEAESVAPVPERRCPCGKARGECGCGAKNGRHKGRAAGVGSPSSQSG